MTRIQAVRKDGTVALFKNVWLRGLEVGIDGCRGMFRWLLYSCGGDFREVSRFMIIRMAGRGEIDAAVCERERSGAYKRIRMRSGEGGHEEGRS